MNQKDYKEIAGIIKNDVVEIQTTDTRKVIRIGVINRLADYFEREDKKDLERTEERFKEYKKKSESFNRQQFLKECGVEK